MSRQDYVKFAAIIKGRVDHAVSHGQTDVLDALDVLAEDMASVFKADNSRFSKERFMRAVGFTEGI